jgi:hypothetical protein
MIEGSKNCRISFLPRSTGPAASAFLRAAQASDSAGNGVDRLQRNVVRVLLHDVNDSRASIEERSESHQDAIKYQTLIGNAGLLLPEKCSSLPLGGIGGLLSSACLSLTVIMFEGPFWRFMFYCTPINYGTLGINNSLLRGRYEGIIILRNSLNTGKDRKQRRTLKKA